MCHSSLLAAATSHGLNLCHVSPTSTVYGPLNSDKTVLQCDEFDKDWCKPVAIVQICNVQYKSI